MTSNLPDLEANIPRCTEQIVLNKLSPLEKKLWAFETVGVGERERMHFHIDSIL